MRAKRNQRKLNVYSQIGVKQQIDEFIDRGFEKMMKKETNNGFKSLFGCYSSQNALLMEYIREIYNEYNIQDPLQRKTQHNNTIQKYTIQRNPNTSKKVKYSSLQKSLQHQQKTKYSFISVNQSKPNFQKINHSNKKLSTNSLISSSHPKQLQNTAVHQKSLKSSKIHFTYRNSEMPQFFKGLEVFSSYHEGNRISSDMVDENPEYIFSKIEQKSCKNGRKGKGNSMFGQNKNKEIKQSYRYCLACQKAVLEGNIQYHEQTCSQYKNLYALSFDKLLLFVQQKILKISQQMHNKIDYLCDNDACQMKKMGQQLTQSISIFQKGTSNPTFVQKYNKMIKIGKKWSEVSEQISKIHWFTQVQEHLKKYLI